MSVEGLKFYPGEGPEPREMLALADEYRRASETLLPTGRRGKPLSRAPYRLTAIHALELYLNAFLVWAGAPHNQVRSYQHNLSKRLEFARSHGLVLRKRTEAHLESLTSTREYLVSRYDPRSSAASQLNRLQATLKEVAEKVHARVKARA